MERAPRQEVIDAEFEVVEVGGWRQLVETAPLDAGELISSIDGFADMEAPEQIAELQMLLERLAKNSTVDNRPRHAFEAIAKRLTEIIDNNKGSNIYRKNMYRLDTVPNGSVKSIEV